MRKIKLKDISVIRSGLVLSRKDAKNPTEYAYDLVALKSISDEEWIIKNQLERFFATERLSLEYLTHKGDILIRMSKPYTAVLIDESTENLLFSSNFTIIRCETDKIIPEYLCWLLNSKGIMEDIQKNNAGNMLGAIRSQFYADLTIEPIPIEKQKAIGALYILGRKEHELRMQLATEYRKLNEMTITQIQRKIRKG
ncbi:MAG: hypothetical protein ACI4SF_05190 [Oscillospiraceae bacterium]